MGGQTKIFHMILSLMERLHKVDAQCVVDWSNYEDSKVFNCAFTTPSATRNALRYCQLVISLDACHTKNHKYPCQLFLTNILDGNMQGLILGYAIVPVENTNNWSWFLRMLEKSIDGIGDLAIPLIFYR